VRSNASVVKCIPSSSCCGRLQKCVAEDVKVLIGICCEPYYYVAVCISIHFDAALFVLGSIIISYCTICKMMMP
jgi:hypothetical protein